MDHSTIPTASRDPSARPAAGTAPAARWLIWLALLALYVIWGSTYIGIRVAVGTIPPFFLGGIRFLISGLVLLAWVLIANRSSIRWPSRQEWRETLVSATFLLVGGFGLVAWGEQQVPSGVAALLIAMMPVWVAVISWLAFHEQQPRAVAVGIVTGLVGVAILAAPGSALGTSFDPISVGALIVSPISWAIGSIFLARHPRQSGPFLLGQGIEMVIGSVLLLAAGAATGELGQLVPSQITSEAIVSLAYLILVGSLIGYTAYGWLLRVAPLPLIATYAYVNPVVAVGLGALLLGERIEPRMIIAGGIIIFAVALIITARSRMGRPAEATRPEQPVAPPPVSAVGAVREP